MISRAFSDGLCQCSIDAPSTIDSIIERIEVHPEMYRPLRHRLSFAFERYHSIVSRVVVLFRSSRPAAVFRTVSLVVVDAIDRMIGRWSTAHVSEEVFIRMTPSLADGDPSPAIARKLLTSICMASVNHVLPCFIFDGTFPSDGVAMSRGSSRSVATTASRPSVNEPISMHLLDDTAIASHDPCVRPVLFVWSAGGFNRSEHSKLLSSDVSCHAQDDSTRPFVVKVAGI